MTFTFKKKIIFKIITTAIHNPTVLLYATPAELGAQTLKVE
jgi:hypothetical protein